MIISQGSCVICVVPKDLKATTVETIQSVLCGDPVEAFAILQHGLDFIGRKTILCCEMFKDLVGRLGMSNDNISCQEQQEKCKSNQVDRVDGIKIKKNSRQ